MTGAEEARIVAISIFSILFFYCTLKIQHGTKLRGNLPALIGLWIAAVPTIIINVTEVSIVEARYLLYMVLFFTAALLLTHPLVIRQEEKWKASGDQAETESQMKGENR